MKKNPVSSTKKPHPTSNPCYFNGVFIIYPFFWGGGGRKFCGASLGGGDYSFQIVSGGRHESFLMSRGPRC